MKMLRTIRLDPSDTFVFERAAEPGEWAVTGTFAFWHCDLSALSGKARTAFRSGFLGVNSLGYSTLVQVVEAREQDRDAAIGLLAERLVSQFGAPDQDAARASASEEIAFATSLADHDSGTLVALHRAYEEGEIREQFRTLKPRENSKAFRAFAFHEVEGEDEPIEDDVDLMRLSQGPVR